MNAKDREKSTQVIHREYKDPQGNLHTEYKDPQGNLHSEYKDPQGNLHTEYKDPQGNLHSEYTDAQGNLHTEYQDAQGNLHSEYTDAQGNLHTKYKDAQGNLHTEYTDPQGSLHTEYRDSRGNIQSAEEHRQDMRELRTDKNISKGMLIGVIVTCVAGLTAGTIYFLTKLNNPQPVSVINVPTYKSTPAPSPPPQPVRVVEKPIVTIVPVPQAQAPGSVENITVNVKPSASNPSSEQGSIDAAQPSKNSDASVSEPIVVSPANGRVMTKTDSDLNNEILKLFQNNLPNNQLIVEVKNGEVAVSGTVATPEQLKLIQPLLKSIPGIGKIDMTATVASKGVAK